MSIPRRLTTNELTMLSVYQSSKIDCFHENIRSQNDGNDVRFGSLAAPQDSTILTAAIERTADIRQEFSANEI